jgi:Ca-activated chloride channel homolog
MTMMPSPSHTLPEPTPPTTGGALVSTEGRVLPLRGSGVRVQAAGGIARVVLEQRFRNVYDVPLTVSYSFPLPADGAVSGFAFRPWWEIADDLPQFREGFIPPPAPREG